MLCIFSRLKKLILVFIILFITGCNAEYNMTINDIKDIKESLDIIENNKELFDKNTEELSGSTLKEYLETNLKWPTPIYIDSETNPIEPTKIDGVSYYNKKDISTSTKLGINYSHNFNMDDYSNSNIMNTCYNYDYKIINNVFTFKTTSEFRCFEKYPLLEKVTFNLNTKCHVINNNADSIEKNKYIWNITKENKKSISFSIDCSEKKEIKLPFAIVVPIYILLVGLGILILKISYKFNNKI